jgi:hypothetical protein
MKEGRHANMKAGGGNRYLRGGATSITSGSRISYHSKRFGPIRA